MAHKQRRASYTPPLTTSMWALTLSVAALVLTLLNTSLRLPCGAKPAGAASELFPPGSDGDRGVGAGAAGAGALGGAGAAAAGAGAAPAAPPRTLSFQVCNGFANQRLSLVYGLVIAKQLGRAAVLPALLTDGTQLTGAVRLAGDAGAGAAPFESFYDVAALRTALAAHGVAALTRAEFEAAGGGRAGAAAAVSLAPSRPVDDVPWRFAPHRGADHLSLDCPLFKLTPGVVIAEQKFIWAVLEGLRPAAGVAAAVERALAPMGGRPFNFLHIRLERDWQAHCSRWVRQGGRGGATGAAGPSCGARGRHAAAAWRRPCSRGRGPRPRASAEPSPSPVFTPCPTAPCNPQVGRAQRGRRRGAGQLLQQHPRRAPPHGLHGARPGAACVRGSALGGRRPGGRGRGAGRHPRRRLHSR
jgi:hypothetical protein